VPTKTPIADILTAYVAHVRAVKTAKSAQTDALLKISSWFVISWRMPSAKSTEPRFNSISPMAIPLRYNTMSGRRRLDRPKG
jgi:hypothetical protein